MRPISRSILISFILATFFSLTAAQNTSNSSIDDETLENDKIIIEEGENWNMKLENRKNSCMTPNSSERISSSSLINEDAGFRAKIKGTMETSNPCQEVVIKNVEKNGNRYLVDLGTNSTSRICVDCVGSAEYFLTFNSTENFQLEIAHDGKVVEKIGRGNSLMDRIRNLLSYFSPF